MTTFPAVCPHLRVCVPALNPRLFLLMTVFICCPLTVSACCSVYAQYV